MARAGDLPDDERAPGVEEGLLAADAEVAQERDECVHGDAFEEDHHGLHEGDGGRDPGDEVEERLRGRRVDGVGVVAAVDVVEDVLIGCAEEGESRVAGDVAVGTDVGVLNDAVPDVAVDVAGEIRFGEENGQAAGDRDGEDDGEGEAVDGLGEDEKGRGEIEDGRPAGDSGEADGVVVVFADQLAAEEEERGADEEQRGVGLPGAGDRPVLALMRSVYVAPVREIFAGLSAVVIGSLPC